MTFSDYFTIVLASITTVLVVRELVNLVEYLIERWDDKHDGSI